MRINVEIDVKKLTDEHLLAEHREIMMLPSFLKRALKSGSINHIPKELNLGKGYITFFINKFKYVSLRYKQVHEECIRRGFNVQDHCDELLSIPSDYNNFYAPTDREQSILENRIISRIKTSPKKYFHYEHNKITKDEAINLLLYGQ